MRGKEQRDSSCAIVKIRPKANELEYVRIAEPIESDPRRAAAAADRVLRQFGCNLVGFGLEYGLVGHRRELGVDADTTFTIARPCRLLIEVFPNHLDLPADFVLIEHLQPSACAVEPGGSRGLG